MSNHVPLYVQAMVQARPYTSVRRPDVSGHTHHPPGPLKQAEKDGQINAFEVQLVQVCHKDDTFKQS